MIKNRPHSGHFSSVDTTIYEIFRSSLYHGVWFSEISQPEVFRISENFKALLGYDLTDYVDWRTIMSPLDQSSFCDNIHNIPNSEYTASLTIRFIHKNGNTLWTQGHIYSKLVPGQNQQFIFVGFKTIPDQESAQNKTLHHEQRRKNLLNDSGVGTWEFNLITGEVIYDESCAEIIGYTKGELKENDRFFWETFVHPDDLAKTRELINEHILHKTSGFKNEVRIKHKNGHWIWVVDTGKVLSYSKDGRPEWLGGIHYTITERKKGELLLQEYKDLLEGVNEAASIGIWEIDLKTKQVYCSKEVKRIFEFTSEFNSDLDHFIECIKEGENRQMMINAINNAIESGENYDIEVEIITGNKQTLWCRAIGISVFNGGQCKRLYGFFQDIHEKVVTLKKLAIKEELFRKTFLHAAVGMAVLDLKGNITRINKSLCHYLGYDDHQILGRNFEQFSHPLDKDLRNELIEELLAGNREYFQLDKRYLHKNGNLLWGHISVSSVRNEMGRIIHFVVQVQDITNRKENELLLVNYKDLLERSNYVAKIGSWEINIKDLTVTWSDSMHKILKTKDGMVPSFNESIDYFTSTPKGKERLKSALNKSLKEGINFDIETLAKTYGKNKKWVRIIGISEFEDGKCTRLYGLIQDINDIKKAQLNIAIKEEQWRTTFSHAKAGMALINFDGRADNVNKSLCDIFGYTMQEMQQVGIKQISVDEDLESNINLMNDLIQGNIENFTDDLRFLNKNGDIIWTNVSVSAVKNDFNEFTHMVAQVVDITESKTNQFLLKEYKESLERSNKVAKIGSWEMDSETRAFFWSENLGALLGRKIESQSFNCFVHTYTLEKYHAQLTNLVNDAIDKGTNFDLELEVETATGLRWMRMLGISDFENGSCNLVHGLIQDIDDFKKAQQEIILREEEFRQTFWHAPIGMSLLDLNGRLIKVNPMICETFGYTEEEMLSIKKSKISHPKDMPLSNKLLTEVLSGKRESFQQEKRYFHKNGKLIWAILSGSAVKNDLGETTHVVLQVNDITDKKLLTESIKEHNNRLQNYAHIVSHNLRSHTGNLSMLLELIEVNNPQGCDHELFEHIKSASNNMKETVQHLSEIVEINNLIKETLVPLNLREEVLRAIKSVQPTLHQIDGEISLKINEDYSVYAFPSYLDSILHNLLTNAIKYRSPDRPLKIKVEAGKRDRFTYLSISDNGLGIDLKKNRLKIFGMYKTFHEHKHARGIGLFISKNQVDAMGGKIEVESQPNLGTTFTIYLKNEKY